MNINFLLNKSNFCYRLVYTVPIFARQLMETSTLCWKRMAESVTSVLCYILVSEWSCGDSNSNFQKFSVEIRCFWYSSVDFFKFSALYVFLRFAAFGSYLHFSTAGLVFWYWGQSGYAVTGVSFVVCFATSCSFSLRAPPRHTLRILNCSLY